MLMVIANEVISWSTLSNMLIMLNIVDQIYVSNKHQGNNYYNFHNTLSRKCLVKTIFMK